MSVGLAPILAIFSAEDSPSTLLSSQASLASSITPVTIVCACDFVLVAALFLAPQSHDSGMSSHTHTFPG